MIDPSVKDIRSEKVIFLTHCCLNQNAKIRGIARFPGAIQPLVELLLENGVGMFQMPCPEMTYLGNMRWTQVKDQYNNPMFRRHCKQLAEPVVDMAQNYLQCGYHVLGFVMMDGSPCCGLNRTPRPKNDILWGGQIKVLPENEYLSGTGVYCEVLQEELQKRGLTDLPFIASPEFDEVGSMDATLDNLRAWMK